MMFHVYANNSTGIFEAENEQAARDAFARDAGYKSEVDMEKQLKQPSEIIAEPHILLSRS